MNACVGEEWRPPNRRLSASSARLRDSSPLRNIQTPVASAITVKCAVRLSDAELEARRSREMLGNADRTSAALQKGAKRVGPAGGGALTHPGRAGETHCYADI